MSTIKHKRRKAQGAKSPSKSPVKHKAKKKRPAPKRVKSIARGKSRRLKISKPRRIKSIAPRKRKTAKRKKTLGGFIARNFKKSKPPARLTKKQPKASEEQLDAAIDFIREQTGLNIPAKMNRLQKLETVFGFREIMQGTRKVQKVTPETYKRYKEAGLKDITLLPNNRIIVPVEYGGEEIEEIEDGILSGGIKQKVKLEPGEAEIVALPVDINSLEKFEAWIDSHPEAERLKFKNENWSFIIGDGTIEGSNPGGIRAGNLSDIKQFIAKYPNATHPLRAAGFFHALRLVRVNGPGPLEERKEELREIWREKERARDRARYAKKKKERGG